MKAYGVFWETCLCHIEITDMYAISMHEEDAEDYAELLTKSGFLKYNVKEVKIEVIE